MRLSFILHEHGGPKTRRGPYSRAAPSPHPRAQMALKGQWRTAAIGAGRHAHSVAPPPETSCERVFFPPLTYPPPRPIYAIVGRFCCTCWAVWGRCGCCWSGRVGVCCRVGSVSVSPRVCVCARLGSGCWLSITRHHPQKKTGAGWYSCVRPSYSTSGCALFVAAAFLLGGSLLRPPCRAVALPVGCCWLLCCCCVVFAVWSRCLT